MEEFVDSYFLFTVLLGSLSLSTFFDGIPSGSVNLHEMELFYSFEVGAFYCMNYALMHCLTEGLGLSAECGKCEN